MQSQLFLEFPFQILIFPITSKKDLNFSSVKLHFYHSNQFQNHGGQRYGEGGKTTEKEEEYRACQKDKQAILVVANLEQVVVKHSKVWESPFYVLKLKIFLQSYSTMCKINIV